MPSAASTSCCRPAAAPSKSGGEFDPLVNERDDGLATLDWIKAQPWFDGRLGLSGPSYLGYAQWAICDALPEVIGHGDQGHQRRVPLASSSPAAPSISACG